MIEHPTDPVAARFPFLSIASSRSGSVGLACRQRQTCAPRQQLKPLEATQAESNRMMIADEEEGRKEDECREARRQASVCGMRASAAPADASPSLIRSLLC